MLPTLKGVFPEPKIQHKRDFLRENKLHVKDIQRNSSRQKLLKLAEEEQKLAELRRRHRHKSLEFLSRRRPTTGCSCECMNAVPPGCCRPDTGSTSTRKVETCNKEVQTEDIIDEQFLYEALKRCSSTDVDREPSFISKESVHNQARLNKPSLNERHLPNHLPQAEDNHYDPEEPNFNFENLAIDTDRLPPTASSTQLSSKRLLRRAHELGDRQDVRLPRYLEREKREKELQKQRDLERDRNCPIGYKALTEEERQDALNTAHRKFQSLINELNHMPMTTETLRIRQRKVEIERELAELENDIQIFSKPKVYVKANGMF